MRIAVITGASSGMGREFVLQLGVRSSDYDEMWVIARSEDKLKELESSVSVPLRIFPLDLTKEESFEIYRNTLEAESPDIRTLVNVAGYGKFGSFLDIPLEDSLGMIDLNCKAAVRMTTLSLPYMTRGANIVMLDSLSAFQPVPYINIYGATKAFILSFSRALNVELGPRGIHVLSVNPYWVKTPFFDRAMTTNKNAVHRFDVLYEPSDVVKTAIRDMDAGRRDVSIHGAYARMQVRLVKLLPHRLVMKIWMKQQNLK